MIPDSRDLCKFVLYKNFIADTGELKVPDKNINWKYNEEELRYHCQDIYSCGHSIVVL